MQLDPKNSFHARQVIECIIGPQAIPLHTVCVLLAVYGLFQPYKSQLINLLEIVVLSNFLFLLMLHSTQSIKDALFVFPILDSSDMGNLTTTDVCHDQLYSGVALFTWLLLPFYYLPLFGFLIVIVVMIFNYLRSVFHCVCIILNPTREV